MKPWLALVDGLEHHLLHNVSHDLEELLALGHKLQSSLSPSEAARQARDDPLSATAAADKEGLYLGKPLSWLSRAESMLQRHFTAERAVTELGRLETTLKSHVEELTVHLRPKRAEGQDCPPLWIAAAVVPLLAFSSADLQAAVLGADSDARDEEGEGGGSENARSCCGCQPVLEAVSGTPLPSSVSQPFMALDEGGGAPPPPSGHAPPGMR